MLLSNGQRDNQLLAGQGNIDDAKSNVLAVLCSLVHIHCGQTGGRRLTGCLVGQGSRGHWTDAFRASFP